MTVGNQHFCLFCEPTADDLFASSETSGLSQQAPLEQIDVPSEGVSYLYLSAGQTPRLAVEPPAGADGLVAILETVRRDHQVYLNLMTSPNRQTRINGMPAPPVAVLRSRDLFVLDGVQVLHVSVFRDPFVGAPTEQHIGNECPYCLVPIVVQTTVYECPNCHSALHMEPESADASALECARLSAACQRCGHPIVLEAGFDYEPEL